MSYATLPTSFWRYALDIVMYLLNLVPSKFVPTTHVELWLGQNEIHPHLRLSSTCVEKEV
jgi:hypothetical protein